MAASPDVMCTRQIKKARRRGVGNDIDGSLSVNTG